MLAVRAEKPVKVQHDERVGLINPGFREKPQPAGHAANRPALKVAVTAQGNKPRDRTDQTGRTKARRPLQEETKARIRLSQ